MAKKNRGQAEEAQIDMTPMLDVVFIMLIFFITTATFVKEAGIEVLSPEATMGIKKPEANIFVAVSADSKVWVDKRQVEGPVLRQVIEGLRAESPGGAVVIQADKRADVGVVIKALDQIKLAGVDDVTVATRTE